MVGWTRAHSGWSVTGGFGTLLATLPGVQFRDFVRIYRARSGR